MPPRDADEWMYDPPEGIREGVDDEAATDVRSVKSTSGNLGPRNRLDPSKLLCCGFDFRRYR